MAGVPSFAFGAGFTAKTPRDAAKARAVYEALAARSGAPTDVGSGLNRIGEVILARSMLDRATSAEQEGNANATKLFAGLQDGADQSELMMAMSDPWVQENPGMSAVTQALLQREMTPEDPLKDIQLQQAQLDLEQDRNATPERKYEKDARGVQRYIDTGEPVFTDMGGEAPPDIDAESKLRTEYNNLNTTKDFGLQVGAYQRVLDSAKDPSPAGDIALIFNYMKILDPGSAVREQEFATAQNAGSIPERIRAQYNGALEGTLLTPSIRADYLKRAGDLFKGASELQTETNDRYSGLASQYSLDPTRIVAPIPKIGVLDPEFKIEEYVDPATGQQTKPLPVTNDADYDALPSGAIFIAPDGSTRKKP